MNTRLNVLVVEDSESDAALVVRQLEKAQYEVKFERVETPAQMKRALKKREWDILLSDHKLPQFSSVAALAVLKEASLDIPFLVISGTIGEETAVELMKAGAHDYIMKQNLKRLAPTVDRELREAKIRREHRLAEEAFQESEKKYRDLVDNALVGVFRTNPQGDILYVNQALWRMFEFESAEDMKRESVLKRYKDSAERQRFLESLQREGSVDGFEMEVLTKSGRTKNVIMSATLGGNLVSGMIMDITARKRLEEGLRESEEKFKNLVEDINDVFYESDADGKITYASPNLFTESGYTKGEILGKRYFHLIAPEDARRVVDHYSEQVHSGAVDTRCEFRGMRKDGSKSWVDQSTRIIRDVDGGVLKYRSVVRDITERKRAEKQISLLAHTVKSIIESVSITDLDDTVLFVNEAFLATYGYDEHELLGKKINIVQSPSTSQELLSEIRAATLAGGWHGELRNRTKDGREFPVTLSTSFVRDDTGRAIALVGVATDITARKRAEEDLRRLLAWQDAIFEGSRDAIFVSDADSRLVSVNQAACLLSGYSREELLRMRIPDLHDPEDLGAYVQFHHRIMTGEEILSEPKLRQKGGGKVHTEFNNKCVTVDGVTYMHTTARDITERKLAEEASKQAGEDLRQSEARYRSVLQSANDAIVTADRNGVISGWNRAAERIFGYTYVEIVGQPLTYLVPKKYQSGHQEEFLGLQLGGKPDMIGQAVELEGVRKDGSEFPMELSLSTWEVTDGQFYTGIIRDISDRKRAEDALASERNLLRTLMNTLPDRIFVKDIECRFILNNIAHIRGLGARSHEEVLGKTDYDFRPRELADRYMAADLHVIRSGEPLIDREEPTPLADNRIRWMLVSKVPLRDPKGNIIGLVGISRDITVRKLAEEAVSASEARFRSVWDNSADGMRLTDKEGRIIAANEAYGRLVNLPREKLVGEIFSVVYKKGGPDGDIRIYQNRFDSRQIVPHLNAAVTLWNSKVLDLDISNSIIDTGGGEAMVLSIFHDITERRQAEQRLEQERTLLRTIIDAIPDEICVKDTERRFVLANPGTLKALKLSSADDIIGKRDEDLMPAQFAQAAREEEESVFATGRSSINKMGKSRVNPVTGEIERSILISKIPLQDLSGKVTGLVGINRDVTELKRAEDMLEKERTLLLTLIESIPDEVCLKDLRHRYLVANRSAMRALNVSSPEALIGKTDADFVPDQLAREHVAEEEGILKSGIPLINRERLKVDPDTGEIERCLLTTKVPVKDQTGKTIGILVINRYITERRRAEEALRASEEKFRALFEESKDAVYISTTDGKLLDINPAGIELFGYGSKEEHMQIDLSREGYVDPREKERFHRAMEKDGFVKDFEGILRRKDGGKITVLETATAVRDKTGKIVQYRGIIRDVTKQRILERQFIQAQKMESIGTLAGGIAHDFNNILGIVLGHLSLLERTRENEAQFKESVSAINKAVERGASLVRQILTFARKAETQFEPVSVNGAVKELAKMLEETLPKTIVLDLKLDKAIPIVSMDATQLHQTLLNLCINARDAMSGEGSLTIATQLVKGDEIVSRFPKAKANHYVHLSVADTGVGMDEETRRRMFEPFFTTKEEGKGTGLGLAVVYGVLQSHDGFVDVETVPGKGTTFHLFFPVPEGILTLEQGPSGKSEDLARGTETILVVEDEEVLRTLLTTVLEMQGYTVIPARDGEEAVKLFGEHKNQIALVLSDMGLPKRSGWDAFRMMREQKPGILAMLASGYLDPGQRSEVLKSGVKRFIHKPYRINEVLKAVRDTLDAKG